MKTILLLIASNLFMTAAWYGHLKHKSADLWKVILVSWLIALPEYALQVPANRWGHGRFDAYQLKIMQEIITMLVFVGLARAAAVELRRVDGADCRGRLVRVPVRRPASGRGILRRRLSFLFERPDPRPPLAHPIRASRRSSGLHSRSVF